MSRDLSRLLRPKSIAVVGGGAWCRQVVQQALRMGFEGPVARVHPSAAPVEGIGAVPDLSQLPFVPDAVFLGVNRHATVEALAVLSEMGAGGAVCFASGFGEALAEDNESGTLQAALVAAAGEMPVLGPNCYGFVNAVDRALLWPDQHGCAPVERGVAIITQSSNIAINLSMQRRGLPVAFLVTCGNMAQTSQSELAFALLDDPRVTAIGLHVEGFGDIRSWHRFARKAEARGVPVIVLKVGASDQAQRATLSHTASLAGSDTGAEALISYLGMARVHDLPAFLETLMLLHCNGFLENTSLASISCSGGEASLVADMAKPFAVDFPDLDAAQRTALTQALGPMVALSNPLDYHTYVWGDPGKMVAAWRPMAAAHIGLVLVVLDYPHTDASAWSCATQAAIALRRDSGRPVAVVSTLPELLPEPLCAVLMEAGVTPLHGLREALVAAQAAGSPRQSHDLPPLTVSEDGRAELLSEVQAKAELAHHGVDVPAGIRAAKADLAKMAAGPKAPVVLKGLGIAHKSDAGAVRLNLALADLCRVAAEMPGDDFLIEEMVTGAVCELLVGVVRDPAHGYVLTLGAGGVLTELWQDSRSLLLPVTRAEVAQALSCLRIFPLLEGYRGKPGAHIPAVIDAVMAVQDYVVAQATRLYEVEVNPLICTAQRAVAADALVARLPESPDKGEPHGAD